MNRYWIWTLLGAMGFAGCGGEEREGAAAAHVAVERPRSEAGTATAYGDPRERITPEELERGRMDAGWRRFVQLDTAALDTARSGGDESWEGISAGALNAGAPRLPLSGDVAGPSVARVQIALDRALFSPGIIDGRWGKNTEKAVYWLQKREGLPATGRVDRPTWERLRQLAGSPARFAVAHRLTPEEVEGPFVEIPEDIYEKAELECMCYESLAEKLAERFHTSPEVLEQLNPGVELNGLRAGETIQVPNVRDPGAGEGTRVARLVVSDGGHYVHALDADGRIVYHFPSTLGSDYNPSPTGDYRVNSITMDPWWHFQPELIEGAEPGPDARIPPGPNNAVGVVWMDLSKPHYGIHGTSAPETIGYATSSGCVRLTNWDARFLGERIDPGLPVEFRDSA